MVQIKTSEIKTVQIDENTVMDIGTPYVFYDGKTWKFGSFTGITQHGGLEFCFKKIKFSVMPKSIKEIYALKDVIGDV